VAGIRHILGYYTIGDVMRKFVRPNNKADQVFDRKAHLIINDALRLGQPSQKNFVNVYNVDLTHTAAEPWTKNQTDSSLKRIRGLKPDRQLKPPPGYRAARASHILSSPGQRRVSRG
jgi:hypothetical protein